MPKPTNCRPVSDFVTKAPLINIPGCPAHPDWVFLTLASLLSGSVPALDARLRPRLFFHEEAHDESSLEDYYEREQFGAARGEPGCLYHLGCRGEMTNADCPTRLPPSSPFFVKAAR
jgi:hydrogenase small subunit